MSIWYCDDNLARCEFVTKKLFRYNVRSVGVKDAEKLMEQEHPEVILTHTTTKSVIEKASRAGIHVVAVVDNDSNIEDLRSAGNLADEVTDLENIEESLGKILPEEKEYDITQPEIPVIPRPTEHIQIPTNYINPPQQSLNLLLKQPVNPLLNQPVPTAGLTRSEVIVVASGKGGVGKTTVAVCLALALQMRGVQVCVLDYDFKCPCVETVLQLSHTKGLKDIINSPENISGTLLDSFMVTHRTGLKVLLPDSNVKLNRQDVEKVFKNLIRTKEVVIVDVGTDTGEHVKACVDFSTKVFIVTALTAPSIQTCKNWLQKMAPRDMTKLQLVINKSDKTAAFPVTAAQQVMGIGLACLLTEEVRVAKGEGNGSPLPERGNFTKEINNLADLVWPWKQSSALNKKGPGLLSSLKELFSRK